VLEFPSRDKIADDRGERILFVEVGSSEWKQEGLCYTGSLETSTEMVNLFFPPAHQNAKEAREMCAECDVAVDCYEYAIANRISDGVWGGVSMGAAPSRRMAPPKRK
jgi:hypothetical protein